MVFLCKDNAKTCSSRAILVLKRDRQLCINTLQTLKIRRYLHTYLGLVTKRGCFLLKSYRLFLQNNERRATFLLTRQYA